MLEVADGTQYLHSEGIIHGDLHGVNILLLPFNNRLTILSTRGMSSLILLSIAKSLILDRLDMLRRLLLNQLRQFPYILLHLNCLACAPIVTGLIAMGAMRATERSIQVKQRKLMFMHSAAFIMPCVSGFPYPTTQ